MKPQSNRAPMKARSFRLIDEGVRDRLINALRHLPIDPMRPLEVVVREEQKKRKMDQQALMWAGPLHDISEQAWLEGRQFAPEIWHEFAKKQFLPEDYDPELCMEGYKKWAVDPLGDRVLVGSTTQLTVRGMSQYIEQLHAFGASLGVMFHARDN